MTPTLKPWPSEGLVIVCAEPSAFRHDRIRGRAVPQRCHDCGCELLADSFTILRAQGLPQRRGRPLWFMCIACHSCYDFGQVSYFEDHRGGETRVFSRGGK